jgi:hypothetical protein
VIPANIINDRRMILSPWEGNESEENGKTTSKPAASLHAGPLRIQWGVPILARRPTPHRRAKAFPEVRMLRPMLLLCLIVVAGCADREAAPAAVTPASPAADPAPPSPPPPAATEADDRDIHALVRPDDTLASFQARLGAANAVARELAGAEGETLPGWVLYPDYPTRTVEVFLDETGAHPAMLRVDSSQSVWRRGDGIRIGLSSRELQTMNGRPFEFSGFDWDYGGAVTDWRGGALDPKGIPRGSLTLCPPESPDENYPSGDAAFSSDDPRMLAQPAHVCEFMVPIGE